MNPHRHTHPCPACAHAVSVTARFCGGCGAELADRRNRSSELRAAMSGIAHRLSVAGDSAPSAILEAARALGSTPVDPNARVVVLGELGRGTRALANLLAEDDALAAGPSQRGAAATLERRDDAEGLRGQATIEVAPPLAEGAESTREGVVPALMRADVVLFALSAAQLLSATERRLLRSLAQLTDAPIALVVGRMDVVETEEDLDDVQRRTERFRGTLERDAVSFVMKDLEAETALRSWVQASIAEASVRTDSAWEQRAHHLLGALAPIVDAGLSGQSPLVPLPDLLDALSTVHGQARSSARSELDDGLGKLRRALGSRLEDMSAEERVHEGASELVAALEALIRRSVNTWKAQLADGLAEHALARASLQAGVDRDASVSELTESIPHLAARLPDQSYGLMAAAVGLSVGVLLLPVGGAGAIAMGVGLTASSYAAAKVLRGRRDDELRQAHTDELDRWLREVGAQAGDWLVDHVDSAYELMVSRLSDLHAHAERQREIGTPEALRSAVNELRDCLHVSG